MNRTFSIWQTIVAAMTSISIYLIMVYIVTPILDNVLIIFGKFFIPERFGGGSDADNPSLLMVIIRGMVMNGLSAYAALKTCSVLFVNAHVRTVVAVFGLFLLVGTALFTYRFSHSEGLGALLVPILALPAFYFMYVVWQDE